MVLVSADWALIIFAAIVIVSIFVAWYMGEFNSFNESKIHVFIAMLTGLGIFVTFLFYYNLVTIQGLDQQLASVQEIARINDYSLNSVFNAIREANKTIPNFVSSITPLTRTNCCKTCIIPMDPENPETCTERYTLSIRIFTLWQETIQSNSLISFDLTPYITSFLQQANSPQLAQQWELSKINFDTCTQHLGDLLFKYGLPITNQIPASYVDAASKLKDDPDYKLIFLC